MMKINVSGIAEKIGAEMSFFFEEAPESIGELLDGCHLEGKVMVKGIAINTGTCFRLEGEIACTVAGICDRCLADFTSVGDYSFMEEYTGDKEIAKAENMNAFEGDIIDIGPLVRDTIISAQPTKHLCSEDCKGLCRICGHNLNEGECDCNRESVDPRLAALQDLLKKNK